jgi:hypothetical protein
LHQKMFMFDGIVQSLLKALIITSSENWQNLPPSPTSLPADMTANQSHRWTILHLDVH